MTPKKDRHGKVVDGRGVYGGGGAVRLWGAYNNYLGGFGTSGDERGTIFHPFSPLQGAMEGGETRENAWGKKKTTGNHGRSQDIGWGKKKEEWAVVTLGASS